MPLGLPWTTNNDFEPTFLKPSFFMSGKEFTFGSHFFVTFRILSPFLGISVDVQPQLLCDKIMVELGLSLNALTSSSKFSGSCVLTLQTIP